jgi:plastocyanin
MPATWSPSFASSERHEKDKAIMTNIRTGLLMLALAVGAGASAAGAQPAPRTIHVDIHGFQFAPARVEALVGDTIEWTNNDFAPHTASDAGGKWSTTPLNKGAVGRLVVRTPGVFVYRCKFHPQMEGTIVVTGNAAQSRTRRRDAHRPLAAENLG